MQYILSEEEYKALLKANELYKKEHQEMVQKLCTMVAEHMPITPRWEKKDKEYVPEPWGCILSSDESSTAGCFKYCDECPVRKECPNPYKHYSK